MPDDSLCQTGQICDIEQNGCIDISCTEGETRPCITSESGICAEGTETCDVDGKFGSCIQDNQVGVENCTDINNLDEDCDGSSNCNDADCATEPNCQVTFPTDYVSWWKFDGNANDESEAYDGTLNDNALIVTENGKQALTLDGDGDYVQINDMDLTGTDVITVSMWVKPNTTSIKDTVMLEFSTTFYLYTDTFMIYFKSNEAVGFGLRGNSGLSVWDSDTTLTPNQWTHIVGVFDTSLPIEEVQGYINGQVDGAIDITMNSDNTNNFGLRPLFIGARPSGNEFFNGSIDNLMIYNRSLTSQEIDQIYQAQS